MAWMTFGSFFAGPLIPFSPLVFGWWYKFSSLSMKTASPSLLFFFPSSNFSERWTSFLVLPTAIMWSTIKKKRRRSVKLRNVPLLASTFQRIGVLHAECSLLNLRNVWTMQSGREVVWSRFCIERSRRSVFCGVCSRCPFPQRRPILSTLIGRCFFLLPPLCMLFCKDQGRWHVFGWGLHLLWLSFFSTTLLLLLFRYHGSMPWLAIPFEDRDAKAKLSEKYGVSGIPTLILVDSNGETIDKQGRAKVMQNGAKGYPWKWNPHALFLFHECFYYNVVLVPVVLYDAGFCFIILICKKEKEKARVAVPRINFDVWKCFIQPKPKLRFFLLQKRNPFHFCAFFYALYNNVEVVCYSLIRCVCVLCSSVQFIFWFFSTRLISHFLKVKSCAVDLIFKTGTRCEFV